ncbi:MAG: T9SS type A sorting domain-containing protein, partial [Saprospiraceae bacterium]|nr:T9SS type A sorting domain-containing protein [Saprospiraceae bacterium]
STVGSDISGLGIGDIAAFNQPYVLQRAPLSYTSGNFSTTTSATVRFSLNDLPDAIKDTILANVPLNLDSMGFGISLTRQDDVDAWGTLEIPGGTYDVLREKRVEIRAGVLEAKVPFLGWTDVTPFIMAIGGLGAIGNDTSVMYYYHSNISKEPIALVSMDATGQNITSIQYKDGARTVGANELFLSADAFTLSPNPVQDVAAITIKGLEKGNYTMTFFDLNGKQQMVENFEGRASSTQLSTNVSGLKKGIYLVTVADVNGGVLGSLKLIKI